MAHEAFEKDERMQEQSRNSPSSKAEQRRLAASLKSIPAILSAIGSSVVGASFFLVISGAAYYQSMFDRLDAMWAFDVVPYAAMIRAGALNAIVFVATTVFTALTALTGVYNRKEMPYLFWFLSAFTVVSAVLYAWVPGAHGGGIGKWLVFSTTLSGAYVIATAITMLLWLPSGSHIQKRWPILAGTLIGVFLLVFWPAKLGVDEADRILSGSGPSRHPYVCLRSEPLHTWRLVSVLDDHYLVMQPGTNPVVLRVIASGEIGALSAPKLSSNVNNLQPIHCDVH